MRNLAFLLSIMLVTISVHASEQCPVKRDDCEFYRCQEDLRRCGADDYLISFGYEMCNHFLYDDLSKYSATGVKWLSDVRYCLQVEINKYPLSLNCSSVKERALDDHGPCYIKTGYCNLSTNDKINIIMAIRRSLLLPEVFLTGINVIKACMSAQELKILSQRESEL